MPNSLGQFKDNEVKWMFVESILVTTECPHVDVIMVLIYDEPKGINNQGFSHTPTIFPGRLKNQMSHVL